MLQLKILNDNEVYINESSSVSDPEILYLASSSIKSVELKKNVLDLVLIDSDYTALRLRLHNIKITNIYPLIAKGSNELSYLRVSLDSSLNSSNIKEFVELKEGDSVLITIHSMNGKDGLGIEIEGENLKINF